MFFSEAVLVTVSVILVLNVGPADNGGGEEGRDSNVQYNNTAAVHVARLWSYSTGVS